MKYVIAYTYTGFATIEAENEVSQRCGTLQSNESCSD